MNKVKVYYKAHLDFIVCLTKEEELEVNRILSSYLSSRNKASELYKYLKNKQLDADYEVNYFGDIIECTSKNVELTVKF